MLHQYPAGVSFRGNGSEFINYRVEKLLNKLLVEFTKSRAHRTTDNALVEGKNGAVVRKHIGHEPIGAEHAGEFQRFYMAEFNPYLNYHRPCGFATVEVDGKGKRRLRYRLGDYRTPYEKLLSLDQWESYLKPGVNGCFSGAASRPDERHRMCAADAAAQERTAGREPLAVVRGRRAAGTFARPPGSLRPGCARRETAARGERKPMDRNVAADLEHAPDERSPAPSQPPRPCPLERRSLPTPALLPTQTRFRIILGLENAEGNDFAP